MTNTSITAKLAAYFVSRKKFGDFGCYLMTPGVEKMLGLTPEEYSSNWRSAETLILAVRKAYPDTTLNMMDMYTFSDEEGDDEKFEKWLEAHKQATEGGRILALFNIDKLKEKILLRGLLATHRSLQLHVIIFQEVFDGDIPPYIWQNSCNAEDINPSNPLMAKPTRPIPRPEPEPEVSYIHDGNNNEINTEPVQQVAPEIAPEEPGFVNEVVNQNAEKGAEQPAQKEAVTEPVRPSVEEVVNEVVKETAEERPLKNIATKGEGFQVGEPDENYALERSRNQIREEIRQEQPEPAQEQEGVKIQLPIAKVPADQARRPDGQPVIPKPIKASPNNYIARAYAQKQ